MSVFISISPKWLDCWLTDLCDYIDVMDDDVVDELCEMLCCWLFWRFKNANDDRHTRQTLMDEIQQGYHIDDIPAEIFHHRWEQLYAQLIHALLIINGRSDVRVIMPLVDHRQRLVGFEISTRNDLDR